MVVAVGTPLEERFGVEQPVVMTDVRAASRHR
jgi:hypothetical protein